MGELKTISPAGALASAQCPVFSEHAGILAKWRAAEDPFMLPLIPAAARGLIRAEVEQFLALRTPEAEAIAYATKLAASYPQQGQDLSVAKVWLRAVAKAMQDFPPAEVRAAAKAVIESAKFRPSVAEVLAACQAQMGRYHAALADLRRMEIREPKPAPKREPLTDQQRAEMEAYMARIRQAATKPHGHAAEPVAATPCGTEEAA
jgi:hypothetical protein